MPSKAIPPRGKVRSTLTVTGVPMGYDILITVRGLGLTEGVTKMGVNEEDAAIVMALYKVASTLRKRGFDPHDVMETEPADA